MTVTVFAESEDKLDAIAAEIRNIAASEGVTLVSEAFAARTHYFGQHPGNGQMRSRKAAITNLNFADLAALHRSPLGKSGDQVPWGKPIALFPRQTAQGISSTTTRPAAPIKNRPAGTR